MATAKFDEDIFVAGYMRNVPETEVNYRLIKGLTKLLEDNPSPDVLAILSSAVSACMFPDKRKKIGLLAPGDKQYSVDGWRDHGYWHTSIGGERHYAAHPYHLELEHLRELVALDDKGWKVYLSGRSQYYPGATLKVSVWKKEP